jgi:hypothetical protein
LSSAATDILTLKKSFNTPLSGNIGAILTIINTRKRYKFKEIRTLLQGMRFVGFIFSTMNHFHEFQQFILSVACLPVVGKMTDLNMTELQITR